MYLLSEELSNIEELTRSSRRSRHNRSESSNAGSQNDHDLLTSPAGPSHVPILFTEPPLTPEPSPRPVTIPIPELATTQALTWAAHAPTHLPHLPLPDLESLISHLTPAQFAHLNANLRYSRRRDFLSDLPPELALHILGFLEDVGSILSVERVCRRWAKLANDEAVWRGLCERRGFLDDRGNDPSVLPRSSAPTFSYYTRFRSSHITEYNWMHHSSSTLLRTHRSPDSYVVTSLAMDDAYIVVGLANGRVHVFSVKTGMLVRTLVGHESGVWCVWLVSRGGSQAGYNNGGEEPHNDNDDGTGDEAETNTENDSPTSLVNMPFQSVFDSLRPGSSQNVNTGPSSSPSMKPSLNLPASPNIVPSFPGNASNAPPASSPSNSLSDPCNTSVGWGQSASIVVSAGCDKQVRVWDVKTGLCLYILRGHLSTVRCLKMFHGRPIAVSGGRDHTVRIWDIRRGLLLKTLEGHTDSVRCLDVYGDRVVSGSYDCSVRLWDVNTGECLRVFNGHYHQVYTVAFDGTRIVSGGLDTSVRVWGAESGHCIALLQGHTALVCQLQLSVDTNTIISGSADGRIIIFGIPPLPPSTPASSSHPAAAVAVPRPNGGGGRLNQEEDGYRIISSLAAHSSSITGLQLDGSPGTMGHKRWLISGGGDGRVLLWDVAAVIDSPHSSVPGSSPEATIPSPPTFLSNTHFSSSSSRPVVSRSPTPIRALTAPCEGLWKVAFRGNTVIICCLRGGRTVLEVWGFGNGTGIEGGL